MERPHDDAQHPGGHLPLYRRIRRCMAARGHPMVLRRLFLPRLGGTRGYGVLPGILPSPEREIPAAGPDDPASNGRFPTVRGSVLCTASALSLHGSCARVVRHAVSSVEIEDPSGCTGLPGPDPARRMVRPWRRTYEGGCSTSILGVRRCHRVAPYSR